MKDKSKKENFKPFDRSFLLKRRVSGQDVFRDAEKKVKSAENENGIEEQIQKLLAAENGPVLGKSYSQSSVCGKCGYVWVVRVISLIGLSSDHGKKQGHKFDNEGVTIIIIQHTLLSHSNF